jgi:polyisoprenoid-binding protein YceI
MKVRAITNLILLLLLVPAVLPAQVFETQTGDILFLSEAPLETIKGRSSDLVGQVNLEENILDFYVDMNTFKTGIKLRDEHLRENYIETDKFPFAEFYGKIIVPDDARDLLEVAAKDSATVKVRGDFSIHGVTNTLETEGKVLVSEKEFHLRTTFIIRLEDYDIPVPQIVFYKLSQDQVVTVTAILERTSD